MVPRGYSLEQVDEAYQARSSIVERPVAAP